MKNYSWRAKWLNKCLNNDFKCRDQPNFIQGVRREHLLHEYPHCKNVYQIKPIAGADPGGGPKGLVTP